MSQKSSFLRETALVHRRLNGHFFAKKAHFARNSNRKSCDRCEKIIAEFTKRGPSQISLEEDMHVFLLRSKDGPKRTQDGAKVAKTVLEASGEPSELRS